MGRDNQAKERQLRRQEAKATQRASRARVLMVTEGSKTEPLYLNEIRIAYRLPTANIEVRPGADGTAPIQLVNYAKKLFEDGDISKGIRPRSFDQVYAVFDRDDHASYFDALNRAQSLDGKMLNDERQKVSFRAIASVPNFELWLLLHYEDVFAPIHRNDALAKLKRHIPGYEKSLPGTFATTKAHLVNAMSRANRLAQQFNAFDDPEPFTGIGELVELLSSLRR